MSGTSAALKRNTTALRAVYDEYADKAAKDRKTSHQDLEQKQL